MKKPKSTSKTTSSPLLNGNGRPKTVEKLHRALRMLSGCNRVLIRAREEGELLKEICRVIVEIGEYRMAWIGFSEKNTLKTVRPAAQAGYGDGYLEKVQLSWADDSPNGRGPTSQSIRAGKPVIIKNIQTDADTQPWQEEALKRGYSSVISLPLIQKSRVTGVLNIYDSDPDAFDTDEVRLLQELADDLAYGISALRTVSERNAATEALRESEERFEGILDMAGDAIISIDGEQNIQFFNKGAEKIFGYSAKEVVNKPLDILLPPQYVKSHRQQVVDFGKTPEPARMMNERSEITGIRKNGQIFPAEASISKFRLKDETVFTVVLRDISDRKQAEMRLRESERRYRLFFVEDLSGDFIAGPDGLIQECNAAFLLIFGFHAFKEAKGTNIASLFPDAGAYQDFMELLKGRKKLKHYELELRHRDSKPLYIIANFIGKFRQGELLELKGYLFDITERKKIERQLFQAQKMEAIGRLASGVSHDFNNTLTAIAGFSDLLMDSSSEDDPRYMLIEEIKNATKSASQLTKQLLAFSRNQILPLKVLNMNAIIQNTAKMLRRIIGEQIGLNIALEEELENIKADQGQMEQIIMNLAVNARDAMPEGGKLTIETRNVQLDENYVHHHMPIKSGNYVMLAVSDNGIGMDEITQLHIFEPFFTTKKKGKGTGLGLSTVYGIVTQLNGYIWVYSEVGHGTTFKIYLPIADEGVERNKDKSALPEAGRGTETILLVEDDERVRKMIFFVLRSNGYNILQARNGQEALKIVDEKKQAIDLLLTDIVMPELSGLELAKIVIEKHPDIRVLYMSGYTDNTITHHRTLVPGVNFLEKPFNANTLSNLIRVTLDAVHIK